MRNSQRSVFIDEIGERRLPNTTLKELLQTVLERGKPFRFRARGVSMTPFVKDGDVVTVEPFGNTSPRLGDVVAFLEPRGRTLAVHRLVGREGDHWFARGDNLAWVDGLIAKADILGRVRRIERGGKTVHWGLGPERVIIAYLSKRRLLKSGLRRARRVLGRLGIIPESRAAPPNGLGESVRESSLPAGGTPDNE